MECPICYCDDAKCQLVCGHSFCRACVKEWWTKSCDDATCPMCRQTLYFNGMYKKVDEWDKERMDIRNEAVYERIFNEIMEDLDEEVVDDFDRSMAMFSIMNLEEVYNRIVAMEWDFDEETMYDLINEYMIEMRWDYGPVTYDDVMPHEKLLFVPKKSSAIQRTFGFTVGREFSDSPMEDIGLFLICA